MSKRAEIEFIIDIRESIKRILQYSDSLDFEKFGKDLKLKTQLLGILKL